MTMLNDSRKWLIASEACSKYGTPRSWLRTMADDGIIKRRTLRSIDAMGNERIKYLYARADIEAALEDAEN